MESKRDVSAPLEALQAILATAKELLGDLASDPLLRRLLQVFAALPPADREPILRVLERDATWTRIVERSATDTGIRVRPNPHASLYVHVFDPVTRQPLDPGPSERD
jgi:hypothetical protein